MNHALATHQSPDLWGLSSTNKTTNNNFRTYYIIYLQRDEFFDLPLPPSFKSLILAVQLPGIYSLEDQNP